jgi:hypothetical protein
VSDDEVDDYIDKKIEEKLKTRGSGNLPATTGGNDSVGLGEFAKFVTAAKGMKEAMTSDLDKAISGAVSTRVAESIVPAINQQQPRSSGGILDSGFMTALASRIPDAAPGIIDVLFARLGKDNTDRLVGGVTDFLAGRKGTKTGYKIDRNDGSDVISSLDPDNPAHLHYYMSIREMGAVDVNIARKSLIQEKENSMRNFQTSVPGVAGAVTEPPSSSLENALIEQNSMMKQIIQKQGENDQLIKYVLSKIESIENEKENKKFGIDRIKVDGSEIENIRDRIEPESKKVKSNANRDKENINEEIEGKQENINEEIEEKQENINEESEKEERQEVRNEIKNVVIEDDATIEVSKSKGVIEPVFENEVT